MPVPRSIRANPVDLLKNVSIGIAIPFSGPSGTPFRKTFSTKEQIKFNLVNLLLTKKGERLFNPNFGSGVQYSLFENITDELINSIRTSLVFDISTFIPEVLVDDVIIDPSRLDNGILLVTVNYILRISNQPDQVTIELT